MGIFLKLSIFFYSSMPMSQPNFIIINLLRIVFGGLPGFLETHCLVSFIKMLQRLVREYMPPPQVQYSSGSSHLDQNQKYLSEVLYFCLEMLQSRISFIAIDAKRSLIQCVLFTLIEKIAGDRVLEMVIKIVHEILISSNGLNLAIPLLIKIYEGLESKLLGNLELQKLFLNSILFVLENEALRTAEIVAKLNTPFFWGLCCTDRDIRSR